MIDSHPLLSLLTPGKKKNGVPLFVFLPGMDGTGLLFSSQERGLRDHVDIRCVVLPSGPRETWETLTDQVVHTIRQEKYATGHEEIYLCGESFGGCLALLVALHAPDLIDHLILVNPATAFQRRIWANWSAGALRLLPEMAYSLSCNMLLPFLANLDRVDIQEAQALLGAMRSVGYPAALNRVDLLKQFDLTDEQYQHITQPTLIVASDRDRLLPSVDEGHWLASLIPNACVHRLPNSGHACLLERDVSLLEIMRASEFGTVGSWEHTPSAPSAS